MFRKLRFSFVPLIKSAPDDDLNSLGVPPCGQYTPEKWAAALERRDYKRFRFLRIPLPPSIFGARLIVIPDRGALHESPIELIILSRELTRATLLHTQTHELAHAALGHPTITLHEGEVTHVLRSNGKNIWEYMTCRANSQSDEDMLCDAKIFTQDVEAERLAQRILGRERGTCYQIW